MTLGLRLRIAASTLLVVTAPGCSERREVRYANYADAARDGAVLRGWVPSYVPPSASEFVGVYDLDTGALLLRFRAEPDSVRAMASSLKSIEPRELKPWPRNMAPPRGVPWPLEPWNRPSKGAGQAFLAHPGDSDVHCILMESPPVTVYAWTCRD